jgi:hypothetical protein
MEKIAVVWELLSDMKDEITIHLQITLQDNHEINKHSTLDPKHVGAEIVTMQSPL